MEEGKEEVKASTDSGITGLHRSELMEDRIRGKRPRKQASGSRLCGRHIAIHVLRKRRRPTGKPTPSGSLSFPSHIRVIPESLESVDAFASAASYAYCLVPIA
jgi:hypothetical protein